MARRVKQRRRRRGPNLSVRVSRRECRSCHKMLTRRMFRGDAFICRSCIRRKQQHKYPTRHLVEIRAGANKLLRVSRLDHTICLRVGKVVTEESFLPDATLSFPIRLLPDVRKALTKVGRTHGDS